MKKRKYKTDVIDFFKKEILTTRILVDNIRKESQRILEGKYNNSKSLWSK